MEPNVPAPSAIELSVIVPCLNEELNLPELTRRVLRTFDVGGISGELVLVDDGSTDGTRAVIEALQHAHAPRVAAVFHPVNQGIAAGWRSGALAARGSLVAILDADLQYQPEDLLRLRRELYEHSVDIVQGFRSAVGRRKDSRFHLSRGLNALLNGIFGMDLQDNKSGFLICAREIFLDLLSFKGTYHYWQSFVMVAAHAKGYSYKQVETIFEQRRQGTSFLEGMGAYRASARSLVDIGKAVIEYRANPALPGAENQFLRRHPVDLGRAGPPPGESLRFRAYMASFDATHPALTRRVEERHAALQKTQWLDPGETAELQDQKLRRLIRHAYRNVPHYRATMQAHGIRPEEIRGVADLARLPVLGRRDVQSHLYFDIMSDNHVKAEIFRTTSSGATGEPFVCYADRAQLEMRWAASRRTEEQTGYRFGDRAVRLVREPTAKAPAQAARERVDALLCNRTLVPIGAIRERALAEVLATIASASPTLLEGDAEVLDLLARYRLARGGLSAAPGAILSSGQALSPESRSRIEAAFGARVFDAYGSGEFSVIAHECEAHEGHHVVAESYVVEILRDGRPASPGELGEVVVTDLNNYCMPFLRYAIGDRAVAKAPAPCRCGRGSPRIGAIEGRSPSIFQGEGGIYLPGTFFAQALENYDHAIRRFQVLQDTPGAITFQVVPGGRYSDEALAEILATFRRHLGERTRIDVRLASEETAAREGWAGATFSRVEIDFPAR